MTRQFVERAKYWLSAVFFMLGTAVFGITFKEYAFLGGFVINTLRAHKGADSEVQS